MFENLERCAALRELWSEKVAQIMAFSGGLPCGLPPSLAIDVTLMAFSAAATMIATDADVEADKRGGFFIASGLFAAAAAVTAKKGQM